MKTYKKPTIRVVEVNTTELLLDCSQLPNDGWSCDGENHYNPSGNIVPGKPHKTWNSWDDNE